MYYMCAHGVECKRMWLCDCVIANGSHWSIGFACAPGFPALLMDDSM